MSRSGDLPLAAYARWVEHHWSALVERPVVLSRRDWARLSRWHALGIPLEIIREAFDAVSRGRRGRASLRGLARIAPAVEEAWSVVVQGRAGHEDPAAPTSSETPTVRELWQSRLDDEPTGSPLARTLGALLSRHERGEAGPGLDDELDRALPDLVPAALRASIEQELTRDLAPFQSRMSAERFAETRRRGRIERLRSSLGLPRLAAIPPLD